MNVVLIGYRCTGKTSVGKRLAEKLRVPFYDTDDLIETAAGCTIREIVAQQGWSSFREREKEVIRTLAAGERRVIATGGGAVMDGENAEVLKRHGILIWLEADTETIVDRMCGDEESCSKRPSLTGEDICEETAEVLKMRTPVYSLLADFTVNTGEKGIGQITDEIHQFLKNRDSAHFS